jgi:large subunit ribosomal protein L35e
MQILYSHDLRKSIARVLTVINAKQRSQLRLFYKNKKYAPLDLRPKQTRAIRRRLSPEDKARVLEKTKKRNMHFPQRKFAVKVHTPQPFPSLPAPSPLHCN